MSDEQDLANFKASQAHYEWYGWDRLPIHPQPGVFETTTAVIDRYPDGETTIITPGMIESLLAQPKFDWREVLRRTDDQWATTKGRGWSEVDGVYHCFRIAPRKTRAPVKIRSLCGERQEMYGTRLLYSAAGEERCGDCLHLEIMKAML